MSSIRIFKYIKAIKYTKWYNKVKKLLVVYYGHHRTVKFQAKIHCIFTLRAVHAYKHESIL